MAMLVTASCAVCDQIESLLQRNHSPRKFAAEDEYRLQQSFLTSLTQEVVAGSFIILWHAGYQYLPVLKFSENYFNLYNLR